MAWPTQEKSRSDCAELGDMHITRRATSESTGKSRPKRIWQSILDTKLQIYTTCIFAHLPFQTHDPTQPTKNTNFRPIPDPTQPAGQPNPRTTLTHTMIWLRTAGRFVARQHGRRDIVIPFQYVRLSVCHVVVLCLTQFPYRQNFSSTW